MSGMAHWDIDAAKGPFAAQKDQVAGQVLQMLKLRFNRPTCIAFEMNLCYNSALNPKP